MSNDAAAPAVKEETKMDHEKTNGSDAKDEEKKLKAEITEKFVNKLPANVRRRVYGVIGIQHEYLAVHEEYLKELRDIERRFEGMYQPLFEKRVKIVTGEVEPTEEEIGKGSKVMEVTEEGEEPPPRDESAPKGIPDFWLTALKNNETLGEIIKPKDEPCLKFLTDVTSSNFDDPTKGFTLTFHFAENPFFSNAVLTKAYHVAEDVEVVIEKCEGCKIDWKEGQNLTVILKKKKQRHKGGKNTRVVTEEVPCDSFFNFFNPPQMPDSDAEPDEDEEDAMEELEDKIEDDYELGRTLKDRIIPKAVDWYTGEAITTMEFQMPHGVGGGDDDDSDGEENRPKISGSAKGAAESAPECKQQ